MVPLARHASSSVWHRQNRPLARTHSFPTVLPLLEACGDRRAHRRHASASRFLRAVRSPGQPPWTGLLASKPPGKQQLQQSTIISHPHHTDSGKTPTTYGICFPLRTKPVSKEQGEISPALCATCAVENAAAGEWVEAWAAAVQLQEVP